MQGDLAGGRVPVRSRSIQLQAPPSSSPFPRALAPPPNAAVAVVEAAALRREPGGSRAGGRTPAPSHIMQNVDYHYLELGANVFLGPYRDYWPS
ncbi:hypothetical protein NDU88_006858 [Pleurodeles waltl]|uniref:Uncharacterized protein n=1 Tax=Pleurodeles waltl TaxID=8319 RepID=A0AAV7PSH3_PLEWA|nr:hypothetical protein NDU88_006858 [Pleurodeles waltl]